MIIIPSHLISDWSVLNSYLDFLIWAEPSKKGNFLFHFFLRRKSVRNSLKKVLINQLNGRMEKIHLKGCVVLTSISSTSLFRSRITMISSRLSLPPLPRLSDNKTRFHECIKCHTTISSAWRRSTSGSSFYLCNACGLKERKKTQCTSSSKNIPKCTVKNSKKHPKRPVCAFLMFCRDRRKSLALSATSEQDLISNDTTLLEKSKSKFGHISSLLAKEWKSLPQDQVQVYKQLAKKDEERYHFEKKLLEASYQLPPPQVNGQQIPQLPLEIFRTSPENMRAEITEPSLARTGTSANLQFYPIIGSSAPVQLFWRLPSPHSNLKQNYLAQQPLLNIYPGSQPFLQGVQNFPPIDAGKLPPAIWVPMAVSPPPSSPL
jgi:hypothetical protein